MSKTSEKRKTKTAVRAAFLEAASKRWEDLKGWYMGQPEASLQDIERHLRPLRQELMGARVEMLLSQGD